jgi:hypothetical protein
MLRRDITHGLLVRCAIRFDVMISTDQAANLPVTCNLRAADNDAVILLAVCDGQHDRHAHAVLDALRDALNTAGIHVLRRVMTRDVTAEGQWLDPDTGECGSTYPYTDSLLTAQRILSGDRVSPDRSDIEAEFATIEPAPPVVIGDHTCSAISSASCSYSSPAWLTLRLGWIPLMASVNAKGSGTWCEWLEGPAAIG